jgi:hypothetical protein
MILKWFTILDKKPVPVQVVLNFTLSWGNSTAGLAANTEQSISAGASDIQSDITVLPDIVAGAGS